MTDKIVMDHSQPIEMPQPTVLHVERGVKPDEPKPEPAPEPKPDVTVTVTQPKPEKDKD